MDPGLYHRFLKTTIYFILFYFYALFTIPIVFLVPLPAAIVQRYNGSIIAVTGHEVSYAVNDLVV